MAHRQRRTLIQKQSSTISEYKRIVKQFKKQLEELEEIIKKQSVDIDYFKTVLFICSQFIEINNIENASLIIEKTLNGFRVPESRCMEIKQGFGDLLK